ncbi:UNVERIFIED_CONTAM: Ubiquinone biosynthesis monooxygenase COQ6, mitochondrial [Sesamum latifolium]|uniref:Ubiquinone biosynthesis monooxygenase COQ6, mitochondrial n=1 Tax=Sesamum latifolium TaxID=2727402 RepID=A0AAW2XVR3_9LAMI
MESSVGILRITARQVALNFHAFRLTRRTLCSDAGVKLPGIDSDQKHAYVEVATEKRIVMEYLFPVVCTHALDKPTKCCHHRSIASLSSDCIRKEDPPDPRVSTVTPASIDLFKDVGAWKYVEQHRHAYFDKMQVWDYTGFGYTRYNAKDINKEILGCVVENKVLHRSLLSCLQSTAFQQKIYPSRLSSMTMQSSSSSSPHGSLAKLELSDGNSLYAKLVNIWRKTIVLGNGFYLMALLHFCQLVTISAIVWTMTTEESLNCKSMSEVDFVKEIDRALDNGYGPHPKSQLFGGRAAFSWLTGDATVSANECFEVPPRVTKVASERMVFPLSLNHATSYALKRVVLIGDAAHTVHPLAGQGVNMGFGDAFSLAKVIAEGIAVGSDIGEVSLLRRYESDRRPANLTMMAILDGFQKAYSVDFGPLNVLRAAAFQGAHYISPLKRHIISYASGEQRFPLFS